MKKKLWVLGSLGVIAAGLVLVQVRARDAEAYICRDRLDLGQVEECYWSEWGVGDVYWLPIGHPPIDWTNDQYRQQVGGLARD